MSAGLRFTIESKSVLALYSTETLGKQVVPEVDPRSDSRLQALRLQWHQLLATDGGLPLPYTSLPELSAASCTL